MHYVQFLGLYFKRLLRNWLGFREDMNESDFSAGKLGSKKQFNLWYVVYPRSVT